MPKIYFYTIKINNKLYSAQCPYYKLNKVVEYLNINRENIVCRGSDSKLPSYLDYLETEKLLRDLGLTEEQIKNNKFYGNPI